MKWLLPALLALLAGRQAEGPWVFQNSGTEARLRGLCAVDGRTAWASGAGGTVLLTTDAGATWQRRAVPDSAGRDFRDVQAFDGRTALVLAIGEGEASRILKTTDGGEIWATKHVNGDPKGFLDALAFWDRDRGLALGDPVDGKFVILATEDGGETWSRIGRDAMPEALPGEGAFAASGTCLAVHGRNLAWFGTGGGRVFRSDDGGRSWTAHATPIPAGDGSSGIFSLAFRDADRGVAVGGDYKAPDAKGPRVALTRDGGRTWAAPTSDLAGYRSAVTYLTDSTLVAVGPTGADRSDDAGATWTPIGDAGFHAVASAGGSTWAAGEGGRIAKLATDAPEGP